MIRKQRKELNELVLGACVEWLNVEGKFGGSTVTSEPPLKHLSGFSETEIKVRKVRKVRGNHEVL